MDEEVPPPNEANIELPNDLIVRVRADGGYRTCPQCGADCAPEDASTHEGIRFAFVCPEHGVHSVIDPFEQLR